jgi:hypothetical protein
MSQDEIKKVTRLTRLHVDILVAVSILQNHVPYKQFCKNAQHKVAIDELIELGHIHKTSYRKTEWLQIGSHVVTNSYDGFVRGILSFKPTI